MEIRYNDKDYTLNFNENGAMFYLTDDQGDMVEWLCSRGKDVTFNQCWLNEGFLAQFEAAGIVEAVQVDGDSVVEQTQGEDFSLAVLCDIIHPEFNDGGFSGFGDFARSRLKQQCQYASRYIDGRLEGYPALGEGLRFNNGKGYNGRVRELNAGDYHSVRIHRDDMDELEAPHYQ